MNDRIKLAEAMGWTSWDMPILHEDAVKRVWQKPNETVIGAWQHNPPDPENDANDDYAVLEWMRNTYQPNSIYNKVAYDFAHSLSEPASYQIGDYARACLKVLDNA